MLRCILPCKMTPLVTMASYAHRLLRLHDVGSQLEVLLQATVLADLLRPLATISCVISSFCDMSLHDDEPIL